MSSTATVSVASSSLAASPLSHEEEEPGGGGSDGDGIIAAGTIRLSNVAFPALLTVADWPVGGGW